MTVPLRFPFFVLAFVVALATGCSCQREPAAEQGLDEAGIADDRAATVTNPATAAATTAPAADATQARLHKEARYAAIATLHRYLGALSARDWQKADAFWVHDNAPVQSGEADLRVLTTLRSLRIENGSPKQIGTDAVPVALEIPVRLRARLEGGDVQHYQGRYRLRRAVVDDGWEITSASLAIVPD